MENKYQSQIEKFKESNEQKLKTQRSTIEGLIEEKQKRQTIQEVQYEKLEEGAD